MIKLRYGYLFMGLIMGLVVLTQFIGSLPDGKLHITICDVGQGDAAYLRFPDGSDIVIDGGPSSAILYCLGKVMPFWDKQLDAVVLTHPEQDHFKGLIDVLQRYQVSVFVQSDASNPTPLYKELKKIISDRHIPVRKVVSTDQLRIGTATLDVLWPAQAFLSQTNDVLAASSVTASSVQTHWNDFGVVVHIRYGVFDAIFTADADERVEPYYAGGFLTPDGVEFLKVPHHGSRTGMTDSFLSWIHPRNAVISVGSKNTYGHPAQEIIERLSSIGANVYRTDKNGSISVETDGKTMKITTEK